MHDFPEAAGDLLLAVLQRAVAHRAEQLGVSGEQRHQQRAAAGQQERRPDHPMRQDLRGIRAHPVEQLLGELGRFPQQQRVEQHLLGAPVQVDRALPDPRRTRDVVHRHLAVAHAQQQGTGGVEDPVGPVAVRMHPPPDSLTQIAFSVNRSRPR